MSGEGRPGNLTTSVTSLIGRDGALTPIAELTRRHPLVTLSGVGGVGKTRLALAVTDQLVDEFPDGVWLVELAPVREPDAVPDAIAAPSASHPTATCPSSRPSRRRRLVDAC